MIIEALQVMLFGMLGIFLVMGVVIGLITLLKGLAGRPRRKKPGTGAGE